MNFNNSGGEKGEFYIAVISVPLQRRSGRRLSMLPYKNKLSSTFGKALDFRISLSDDTRKN